MTISTGAALHLESKTPAPGSNGTVRLLDRDEIVPVLATLHDRLALRRPAGSPAHRAGGSSG